MHVLASDLRVPMNGSVSASSNARGRLSKVCVTRPRHLLTTITTHLLRLHHLNGMMLLSPRQARQSLPTLPPQPHYLHQASTTPTRGTERHCAPPVHLRAPSLTVCCRGGREDLQQAEEEHAIILPDFSITTTKMWRLLPAAVGAAAREQDKVRRSTGGRRKSC